jgi:VanZ family protein
MEGRATGSGGPPKIDDSTSIGRSWFIDVGIWVLALLATGLTVWYSLGSTPPVHSSDKDLHAVAYFVDTFAILLALVWRPGRESRQLDGGALPVALAVLGVGALMEIIQGFVDRDAQFGDWIADAVGIGLALLVFTVLRRAVRGRPAERPG